jgi:mannitol/fructose-specific phosphotransferase system IIA component (Ntr-type)
MNISRLIDADLIELSMTTRIELDPENPERSKRQLREDQELIFDELVGVLERSDKIGNRSKLLTEFVHRERKAATAVGHGIAIPHVRTYQAKELILAIARSDEGYDFGAPDGEPVRLFFVMAAPSYDDNLYLKVFKALAELLRFDYFRDQLMTIEEPFEMVRAFREIE